MAALSKWVPIGTTATVLSTTLKPQKLTTIDIVGGIYCHICNLTFGNKKDFDSHYTYHGIEGTEIVYTCVICHKGIVGYPSFRGHCYLAHVTKDKFKCEHCQKMFSKSCILQTHIKNVHTTFKCPTCQKQFQSQKDLIFHQVIHNKNEGGPPFDCQSCSQQIDTTDDCEHHIEDHCTMFYSCPICNEDIPDIQKAAGHLTKHFGCVLSKQYNPEKDSLEISNDSSIDLLGGIFCIYCDNLYKVRQDFDNHFLSEHGDKEIIYACNICGKEYDKYLLFANHCYDHSTKDRFECEECLKTFPRLSLLVIHMEAYHSGTRSADKTYPFTCLQCHHGFKTDRRLKEHYRSTHGIYYSQCPEKGCGKTFDAPKDLILHLKEHKSVHNNWCRQCGLQFYSLQACEKHLQVHRKKHYSCPICSRQYGEKYLIMKHVPQHFSTVFHVCKVCGKVYNGRNRLVQHMKVHSENKQHKCQYCGKGFTKTYLLQQHVNVHTGLKPHKCTVCPKTFASHPNLRKHLKNLHNITSVKNMNEKYNQNMADKVVDSKETSLDDSSMDEVSEIAVFNNNHVQSKTAPTLTTDSETSMNLEDSSYELEEATKASDIWKLDSIDPVVLDMLEEQMDCMDANINSINELEQALWVQGPNIQSVYSSSDLLTELQPVESAYVPREFGPEFVNGVEASSGSGEFIHLDDHMLPHIDPRLTVTDRRLNTDIFDSLNYQTTASDHKWEPIITKVYQEFNYADITDSNRLSVLNTDIY